MIAASRRSAASGDRKEAIAASAISDRDLIPACRIDRQCLPDVWVEINRQALLLRRLLRHRVSQLYAVLGSSETCRATPCIMRFILHLCLEHLLHHRTDHFVQTLRIRKQNVFDGSAGGLTLNLGLCRSFAEIR